jgi:hypothetical protein
MTQDEIAQQNGYKSKSKVSEFKSQLCSKIPELGKIEPDELEKADLDFLMDYKQFIESDLLLYNIWNTPSH